MSKHIVFLDAHTLLITAAFALLSLPGIAQSQALPSVVELAELNTAGSLDGTRFPGGSAFEAFGSGLRGIGDINADGYADVAFGAPGSDPNGVDSGTVYVLFGRPGGFPPVLAPTDFDQATGITIRGKAANSFTGWDIAAAGDLNDDGIDDLAISAPLAFTGIFFSGGETYIVYGRDDGGFPPTIELAELNGSGANATPGVTIRGAAAGDQSGFSIDGRGGDFNSDGVDDLLIGVVNADIDPTGSSRGQVVILFGQSDDSLPEIVELMNLNGTGPNAAAGVMINGQTDNERIGGRVRNVGDVDGDGIDDILIANSTNSQPEFLNYLVYGSDALPEVVEISALNGAEPGSTAGATIVCTDPCFESVGAVGDFNADGVRDFAVGQTFGGVNGISSGDALIVFGSGVLPDTIDLAELNGTGAQATPGVRIEGAKNFDFAGNAIDSAGDFNGDGFDDVLVAAWRADTPLDESGITYVLFGGPANAGRTVIDLGEFDQPGSPATNGLQINGVAVEDRSGEQVSLAGDLNADGGMDVLISAVDADRDGFQNAGESYVVYGVPVVDLAIEKSNDAGFVQAGQITTYRITVTNLTQTLVEGVVVEDSLPATLDSTGAGWTCSAMSGSSCSEASGAGDIETTIELGPFGRVDFELSATVVGMESGEVVNRATVSPPVGTVDRALENNVGIDRDPIGLFIDGFEG